MQVQKKTGEVVQNVWRFDPSYSSVEFTVTNLFFFKVRGRLGKFSGAIILCEGDISRSSVVATLSANSIDTGNARRDEHLRGKDFLDAEHFPEIEFQSDKVTTGKDRDTIVVMGNLSIKGRSKPVVLQVNAIDRSRSPQGEEFVYYTATTELDRYDFDISYGPGAISRKLKITINIQASRQP